MDTWHDRRKHGYTRASERAVMLLEFDFFVNL